MSLAIEAPTGTDRDVDAFLAAFFADAVARAEAHGPDYRLLWEAARDAADGGKRIRPRLVLAAHDAFTADGRSPDAVRLAGAFELLHTAFLMHDDVIDHDLVRRGEPNVAGRFVLDAGRRGLSPARADEYGRASAILAGDLLIAGAYSVAASLDAPAATRRAVLDVVDGCVFAAAAGEHADVRHSTGVQAEERDILAVIEDKTASYSFSAPLQAGALLAGADPVAVERLGEIGRHLGIAFQLRDDVLGVFGVEQVTGKSAIGDLREGKATLLVAYARSDAAWQAASDGFGRPDLDEPGAERLRAAIESSGARRRVEGRIRLEARLALESIATAALPERLESVLARLVATGIERAR
ncbi:polyprenyl synthetase family protein [Agromyces intestinalis]|uniref:Polyprenyl synthetase family protein n=1 Tax=Agromyces intestinalis TaxID=2592652 RepID=A0A5C1YH12_9MICO|nr:polyprenyl synthetase family protein [Agromyces intestinalis]QEO14327.1 polyprenyl synthetase family protein [Agromyces intestinalis]